MQRGVCLFIASSLILTAAARGAPQADLISPSWQLDFNFRDPQRITITLPGSSTPSTYWYVLFEVTNNTGRDREFYPSFEIVTNTLRVIKAGDGISPRVYEAIAERHRSEFPFFATPARISGPLLQGAENSRASAAVFQLFDPEASEFTLYVAGLSGEVTRVSNPVYDPDRSPDDVPAAFVLRRTLAIKYDMPGDPATRSRTIPVRRSREWTMR